LERVVAHPVVTEHEDGFGQLDEQLAGAMNLVSRSPEGAFVGALACLSASRRAAQRARVDQLIEAGAWTDAALALVEQELPAWRLRRLVCEDGEWFCSLSRQPNLPVGIDDAVEAGHEILPLAILAAFVEARRRSGVATDPLASVPLIQAGSGLLVCCDNYA
jgi:hypothetical protein